MRTFNGIIGNRGSISRLEAELASGEVSHAYLFYGPFGVGKRSVARRFGAALVAGEDEAAQDRALRGVHPDLLEVRPEGRFTTIEVVREMIGLSARRPAEGRRRVFILEASTLAVPAANALLKTLESPQGPAVFILLGVSRESVLPTILSRCRALRFAPVPAAEISGLLRDRGFADPEVAAALGRGSVGLALRYAGGELTGLRDEVFRVGLELGEDAGEIFSGVARIMERASAIGEGVESEHLASIEDPGRRDKDDAKRTGRAARNEAVGEALDLLALLYRDAAVVASGVPDLLINTDRAPEIETAVSRWPGADWAEAALRASRAREDLARNITPEAVLESVLLMARREALGAEPLR